MKVDRVKGHLDLLLLGILNHTPGHGYSVITTMRERSGGALDLTEGSVYPALHRLEDLGLLSSHWQLVGGRRRRVYEITRSGASALVAERKDWTALVASIEAVLSPRTELAGGAA